MASRCSTASADGEDIFVAIRVTTDNATDAEARIDELFVSSITNELADIEAVQSTFTLTFGA